MQQANTTGRRTAERFFFVTNSHPSYQQSIMLFTAFAFFAALVGGAYAAPASSRTVISAPQGNGQIIVSQTQLRVTGCLNAAGLWSVAGDCATFTGDEEGGISGPEGYLLLTQDGITTSPSSDTTWLGYYLNGNVSIWEGENPDQVSADHMGCSLLTDTLSLGSHPLNTFLPTRQV